MAKMVAALLVLALSTIAFTRCKRCGYVKKHTHYPAYSTQLKEVVQYAIQKTKIKLNSYDIKILNKIIHKENRTGNLTTIHNGCYGLGQGKRSTYINSGVPWKTVCPVEQVMMIIIYIKGRYKTFNRAWAHHLKYNWY